MTKLFYKFALLMAIITFLTCLAGGISLLTCLLRALTVLVGILFTIFIAGYVLQFGLYITTQTRTEDKDA
ncbi:MAG: hypothetical protein GXO90_04505 [FCB group bacterium]|nr:hypothetical protein [FCB group bacterium]